MNNVCLIGRLTKDVESHSSGETQIAIFTIAVDKRGKDNGASFFNVVCFSTCAENVIRFVHRGSLVGITGYLNQKSFERKDGTKGYVVEVVADVVQFLDPKPASPEDKYLTEENTQKGITMEEAKQRTEPLDDDLPF